MKAIHATLISALHATLVATVFSADDILVADFEHDTYALWTVTGEAFGAGSAHGKLPSQMKVDGFKGKGLVNSFHGGDDSTGRLESPAFKIERKFLTFLIGGGGYADETCMNLVIGGKVVRTATGPNIKRPAAANASRLLPGMQVSSRAITPRSTLSTGGKVSASGTIHPTGSLPTDSGPAFVIEGEAVIERLRVHHMDGIWDAKKEAAVKSKPAPQP